MLYPHHTPTNQPTLLTHSSHHPHHHHYCIRVVVVVVVMGLNSLSNISLPRLNFPSFFFSSSFTVHCPSFPPPPPPFKNEWSRHFCYTRLSDTNIQYTTLSVSINNMAFRPRTADSPLLEMRVCHNTGNL